MIVSHWGDQTGCCVSRWVEFVEAGEIDEATAQRMVNVVWGGGGGEEDEWLEDDEEAEEERP